jgi:hypothetical protein
MISHKQINRVILILTFAIMICASPYCSAGSDEGRDTGEIKTGDIEVFAHGSSPPPYENGILLTLNRMPDLKAVDIPDWVKPLPESRKGRVAWFEELKDSFGDSISIFLDYIYDSLGYGRFSSRPLEDFSEHEIKSAISDTMGYYLFKDISIGHYQIICMFDFVPESDRKVDDSLKNETDDSTVEYFEIQELRLRDEPQHHGIIDNIRVATDSISVVEMREYRVPMPSEEWPSARDWIAKFKQKGGDNHDKP